VRLALCQTNSGDDVVANERQVTDLLERAADGGADLAALPEVWPRQGSAKQIRESAEPVPGPRTERLGEIAARHRMWVHGGSVLERDGERVFNTSVLLDRDGNLVATYRKIHLFDADPPGAVPSRESSVFSAGDQVVTSETEFGRVGLSICYDVRFPELYRTLALAGAEVLAVPANFTERTGRDHWEALLRARAIENGAWVIAPAQIGGPTGHPAFGRSMVIDPWGTIVAQAPDAVSIVRAELDTDRVAAVRRQIPALANRRPDAYRLGR
jgi:predicted amidohydrolase